MSRSTLTRLAFGALVALAGCTQAETPTITASAPADMTGWRLSSGKTPTKAEFAALVATCQEKGGAVDPCFAELGLKKAP
jgi:hypothetical protein